VANVSAGLSVRVADEGARLYTGPVRPMTSARFSLSLVGVIGVFAAVLAAASLWLVISDPVKVATGVQAATEGNVSPIVKALADVLYDALQGIIKYL
jgi:hypothetical protein